MCNLTLQNTSAPPEGANKTAIRQLPGTPASPPPTSPGLVFGLHLPQIRGCTVLWLKSTHPSLPPGSGLTSPTTDYFEPFSGYIIASLSSSLYSPYRGSIAAKPHIESCNYPDCHLIAGLFISSITAGPANSSWGQRERKGLLVAQCATDSSSLWYIYSSSWVQSKLMHRGNSFFYPHPFPSTLQRLLSLSPFLVSRSECTSWIGAEQTICDPISLNLWQHSIHAIWAFTAHHRPSEGGGKTSTATCSSLTLYKAAKHAENVDLLVTFDRHPMQLSLFWIGNEELGATSVFLWAEWKGKLSFKGQDLLKCAAFSMRQSSSLKKLNTIKSNHKKTSTKKSLRSRWSFIISFTLGTFLSIVCSSVWTSTMKRMIQ